MERKGISRTLIEENYELKQYIDSLNKECMELQAALFEEANNIAKNAYAAEHAAVKRAEEMKKENSVLKKEVKALKKTLRLHLEENSDVLAVRRSLSSVGPVDSPTDGEEKNKGNNSSGRSSLRRLSFLRRSTSSIPPPSQSSPGSTYTTSIINVTSQEPVTRRALLEALTSSTACAETVGNDQFQEFLDWVDGGCCTTWPEGEERRQAPFVKILYDRNTNENSPRLKRNDSDAGDIRLPYAVSYPSLSSTPESTTAPSLLPPTKAQAFFHRLVREDIAPALDFANAHLCKALCLALRHLGVEMEPLSALSNSTTTGAPTCPLVPGEPVKYGLKVEVTNEDGSITVEHCAISSWARERIAAVADLLQYLSLIRRGLTGTPTTPVSRSPSDSLPSVSRDSTTESTELFHEAVRRHQFENLQRRRLTITLARLGYGLPSME